MSRFLRLVEENRPGEDKYTVELRDVNGELIDSFEMWGTGSPFENFDTFKREFGAPIPAEDIEVIAGPEQYDVDTAVTGLAAKAASGLKGFAAKGLGTGAQEAKSAVKKRDNIAKKAVRVYKKRTKELKDAVKKA
tara:strand:+ start:734 stop:1138 length:405 start_codon:yes stop_codon:yes gene_type:complete